MTHGITLHVGNPNCGHGAAAIERSVHKAGGAVPLKVSPQLAPVTITGISQNPALSIIVISVWALARWPDWPVCGRRSRGEPRTTRKARKARDSSCAEVST